MPQGFGSQSFGAVGQMGLAGNPAVAYSSNGQWAGAEAASAQQPFQDQSGAFGAGAGEPYQAGFGGAAAGAGLFGSPYGKTT